MFTRLEVSGCKSLHFNLWLVFVGRHEAISSFGGIRRVGWEEQVSVVEFHIVLGLLVSLVFFRLGWLELERGLVFVGRLEGVVNRTSISITAAGHECLCVSLHH